MNAEFILIVFVWAAIWTGFCRWLAVEKGRSAEAWLLIRLIFGPIALLTLVGAPVLAQKSEDALTHADRQDREKEEPENV